MSLKKHTHTHEYEYILDVPKLIKIFNSFHTHECHIQLMTSLVLLSQAVELALTLMNGSQAERHTHTHECECVLDMSRLVKIFNSSHIYECCIQLAVSLVSISC